MRSTRATELIEIYPAHMVNAWLGHTEAVAMAHYRQTTGKAAEKFFEQAAGLQKKVQESAHVHAGIGCFGVETGKKRTGVTSCDSSTCNDMQGYAKSAKPPPYCGTGIRTPTKWFRAIRAAFTPSRKTPPQF